MSCTLRILPKRPKTAGMGKSKIESLLICLFDSVGSVLKKLVALGQTIRLRKRVIGVISGITDKWMPHLDVGILTSKAICNFPIHLISACLPPN